MHTELRALLDRMTTKEKVLSSDQSVSWQAHRVAERLTDETWIDDLELVLSTSKSKDERRAAHFILGAIGANTGSARCAEILIRFTPIESDKYALASLLDALSKINIPDGLELAPVFRLLQDSRWLVRHAAITALKGSSSIETEEQVLAHLARTDDPYDKAYCHATLNRIGTPRAIFQIKQSLTSRKRDVRVSAEAALLSIEARHARNGAQPRAPPDVRQAASPSVTRK